MKHALRADGIGMLTLVPLAALAACSRSPAASLVRISSPGEVEIVVPVAGLPSGPAAQGELSVSVHWPRQVQVIPTDTQTISLAISGQGVTEELSLERLAGQSEATASVLLPQGGYTLSANAYDPGGAPTAQGTASSEVLTDQVTRAMVNLGGLYVPAIASFSPPDGAPGTTVFLYGSNFRSPASTALSVLFGSLPGSSLNVLDADTATVLVPPAAADGQLSVSLDGVPGVGSAPFTVLGNISLATTSIDFYPSLGVTSATLSSIVTDTSGNPVSQPWVYWSDSTSMTPGGGSPVNLSFSLASGSETVVSEPATVSQTATGTISVGSGELTRTLPFTIHP